MARFHKVEGGNHGGCLVSGSDTVLCTTVGVTNMPCTCPPTTGTLKPHVRHAAGEYATGTERPPAPRSRDFDMSIEADKNEETAVRTAGDRVAPSHQDSGLRWKTPLNRIR